MDEHQRERFRFIRKILPFTSVAVILAALYVGWIFYSRWQENREREQKHAEATSENNRKVLETLGSELRILSLSLDRGAIRKGEKLTLCYGVVNAKSVRIEPPPAEEIWPSMNRCIVVAPKKDTKYTLTATDASGKSQNASVEVHVAGR